MKKVRKVFERIKNVIKRIVGKRERKKSTGA